MARRLAVAYQLCAFVFALYASVTAMRDHYTMPFLDDWRILDHMFSRPVWQFLLTDQNGHRIPGTLLLVLLDYRLFSGRMHLLVISAVLCAWVAAASVLACARGGERPTPLARVTLAYAGFALFWAGSYHDFLWGMNQGSQQAVMWLMVALAALAHRQARPERHPGLATLVTGVAAVLATFSHGTGAAVWPAVVAVALAGRLPLRVVVGLVVAAFATVAVYSSGLQHIGWQDPPGLVTQIIVHHLPHVMRMAAALVGSAVVRVGMGFGWVAPSALYEPSIAVGALGMGVLGVYGAWLLRRGTKLAPLETLALGLMVFGGVAGMLVGTARAVFPTTAVQDRFITWSTLFWMGVVAAAASLASGRVGRLGELAAIAVIIALSLSMLTALREIRRSQAHFLASMETRTLAHLLGVEAGGMEGARPLAASSRRAGGRQTPTGPARHLCGPPRGPPRRPACRALPAPDGDVPGHDRVGLGRPGTRRRTRRDHGADAARRERHRAP